jgi:hypothetical protein
LQLALPAWFERSGERFSGLLSLSARQRKEVLQSPRK